MPDQTLVFSDSARILQQGLVHTECVKFDVLFEITDTGGEGLALIDCNGHAVYVETLPSLLG